MKTAPATLPRPAACLALAVIVGLALASCSSLAPPRREATGTIQQRAARVTINGASLDIHLARRVPQPAPVPLVVFASGDGGWFGAAIGMFDTIASAGYPVAGVSSRALLRALRTPSHQISNARLLDAYGEIIGTAERAFSLPAHGKVILAGWSRGASIAVILGAERQKTPATGVVAIGLAAEEDLNVDLDSDDEGEPVTGVVRGTDTYAMSRAILGRVAVIQSTGDGYVAADRARALFGADTRGRHFYEVPATNHRFSGGATTFRQALRDALTWISTEEDVHQ